MDCLEGGKHLLVCIYPSLCHFSWSPIYLSCSVPCFKKKLVFTLLTLWP